MGRATVKAKLVARTDLEAVVLDALVVDQGVLNRVGEDANEIGPVFNERVSNQATKPTGRR
jgi:hypothetical protein